MTHDIRNRIKDHRRVRASDLVPHEWNYRLHPHQQQQALQALYLQVGFARSLLAYELPDGRLKLIDGHLRREMNPDTEVDVEVLDVTEEEARILLLSIDPLAALAQQQEQLHNRLQQLAPEVPQELRDLWNQTAQTALEQAEARTKAYTEVPEQYHVLVTCRDEAHQVELLARFATEGLPCKALLT